MQGLSPHGMLHTMTTPVYLLHGEANNIIPAAETLWMASELPGTALQEVLVSPVLSHLDLGGAKPDVWDQWRLGHFFVLGMRAAERKERRSVSGVVTLDEMRAAKGGNG